MAAPQTPDGGDPAADPAHDPTAGPARRRTAWRVGTPLVLLATGALLAVSAANSDGTDLRPGRYTSLASLVRNESDQARQLQERVAALDTEVGDLSTAVRDERVSRYRAAVARLGAEAGTTPQRGAGVTVVLSDAPEEVISTTTRDVNLLLVHQQDIQAVVNAMWAGGATAVTVAGQRVVSTTGIKCEGNTVLLGGIPYPQPFTISAVGDQDDLLDAVADDPYLQNYRAYADLPDVAVGWDLELETDVRAPAYEGLLDLSYAEPTG